MLTLFHSPRTRSTRVVALLAAMGRLDDVDVRSVSIPRVDGSGGPDAGNPHPEGKVPLLVHDAVAVRESAAIMLYLTDLFAEAGGLGVPVGDPLRGRYLAWLAWYAGVLEPVMVLDAAGLSHPFLPATFRGVRDAVARLDEALAGGPWLVAGRYTAADLLCASPFLWFPDLDPGTERVREWVARCGEHPSREAAERFDAALEAGTLAA